METIEYTTLAADEELVRRLSHVTTYWNITDWKRVNGFRYHGGKLYRGTSDYMQTHVWVLFRDKEFTFVVPTAFEMLEDMSEAETVRMIFQTIIDVYQEAWRKYLKEKEQEKSE